MKLARTSIAALLSGAVIVFAAGCAGNNNTDNAAKDNPTEERTTAMTSGGTTRVGETRSEEATLEVKGDPGIEFSGTCTVGDEENKISGQVPQSFVYELDERPLDCQIRKNSPSGNLQLVFTAGGTRAVQQVSGALSLTYSNGMVSFSSSGSGDQVSSSPQQAVSSSSAQNISSSSQQVISSSYQNNSSSISISQ